MTYNDTLTHGDLFSGLGGFAYAHRLSGHKFSTKFYVEKDSFCQELLLCRMRQKRLDPAPIWPDISTFDGRPWRGKIFLLTGGFPCQDVSLAGQRAGIDGERSGLWREYFRVICEIRPARLIIENVPGLFMGGGFDRVVRDLASARYDFSWSVIGASDPPFFAPHRRKRIWLCCRNRDLIGSPNDIPYTASLRQRGRTGFGGRVEERIIFPHQSTGNSMGGETEGCDSLPATIGRNFSDPKSKRVGGESCVFCYPERGPGGSLPREPLITDKVPHPTRGKSGKPETGNGRKGVIGGGEKQSHSSHESGCTHEAGSSPSISDSPSKRLQASGSSSKVKEWEQVELCPLSCSQGDLAHSSPNRIQESREINRQEGKGSTSGTSDRSGKTIEQSPNLAHPQSVGSESGESSSGGEDQERGESSQIPTARGSSSEPGEGSSFWGTECRLGFPPHGVSVGFHSDNSPCGGWECGVSRLVESKTQKHRKQRLMALGNAIVPQVAAYLFWLIAEEWKISSRLE